MQHVLVTGGAGYIGSHGCKALARRGFVPVTYDNMYSGHEWAVKWGPLERGDIRDRDRLNDVFEKYDPIAVMHFAGFAYVGESVENPGKYYSNNVVGSLNLLEAMRDNGVRQIVFSSTCATYGVPESLPIPEHHPQQPINPYGASKLMVERLLSDFGGAHAIRAICLRYFNAAGADPDGEIGEDHDPETHLIPLILDVAAGERTHVTIFGSDYDTPDGTCIRDYIHVTDLADAHVLALQALEQGAQGTSYNLSNEAGFSVKQIIGAASQILDKQVPTRIGPRRTGDPPCLIGDSTRAKSELGWAPVHNGLSTIIQTAWNWRQANM